MKKWSIFSIAIIALSCRPEVKETSEDAPKKVVSEELKDFTKSKDGKFLFRLEWVKGPVSEEYSEAKITFLNADGSSPEKIEDAKITPWMKVHGHGTGRVRPKLESVDGKKNIFKVTNIYFIMSGKWELNISAKVENQDLDTFEYLLTVP